MMQAKELLDDDPSARAEAASPDWSQAIDPGRPLILDFDETYWLRNSTEAFLDSARPAWLAAFVLKGLDAVRPWRLLPGPEKDHVWRDWLRVLLIVMLLPWTLLLWPRRAARLGPKWLNPALSPHVARVPADQRWIVTNGFRPIVGPLVGALPEEHRPAVLASPLVTGFQWRRRGKLAIVEEAIGPATLGRAVVVTDNDEDRPLLQAAARPIHRKWADARYEAAHRDAYVPFHYVSKVKRPGQNYLANVILKDELILILLVYLWASFSIPALLAILLLHVSFWVIYEIVYVENDDVAHRYEAEPVLSASYASLRQRFSEPEAWATGLAIGFLGVAVHQLAPGIDGPGLLLGAVLWCGWLLALRAVAYLYNHVDKPTRVPLYLVLQVFKLLGLALFFPLPLAAAVLLAAHLAMSWVPYIAYRQPGSGSSLRAWRVPNHLYRFELAVVLAIVAAIAVLPAWRDGALVPAPGDLALLAVGLAWFAWKARDDVRLILANGHWLKRHQRRDEGANAPE
jgi:hypothetical protein